MSPLHYSLFRVPQTSDFKVLIVKPGLDSGHIYSKTPWGKSMIGSYSSAKEEEREWLWEKEEETEGTLLDFTVEEKLEIKNLCRRKWLEENTCKRK